MGGGLPHRNGRVERSEVQKVIAAFLFFLKAILLVVGLFGFVGSVIALTWLLMSSLSWLGERLR